MLIWVLQSSHCFKIRLAQHCGRRGANVSENKGVRSECKKFGENSRQMAPVSTICDEYCSFQQPGPGLHRRNRAYTKTTFWRAPSKHREELAWFPCRGTFWHSWSLNQRRSSSRNYALRGKRATEAHGDAPDFPTWHQSSMRLKLRLPFPLGRARRCACTTKFFECVYFFFRGVSKPCNDSNVLVTSLIKRQAWNVWRGTQTKSRHYCSLFFVENYPLLIQTRCNVGSCAE